MRLETCIRKGLGLKAHRVKEVREEEGGPLVAEVERIAGRSLRCGCCGGPARQIHSRQKERQWRDLSVRDRPLVLRYAPVRVFCSRCGVKVEQIPWASRWQRVTRALALAIARLARDLSWKQTARHFGVDWKTVVAAVRAAVVAGLLRRRWKPLHTLGIDEVSRSKGQRYLTLVYDLVCCDMWAVYLEAVREHLPQATIVLDRFHVVQHLNRAVDDVRRQCWRELSGMEKSAFKRTRWLWLKNPWNLQPQERRRLSALCRKNQPIVRAYYLKEAFQRFWDYCRRGWALPYLKHWLWWASHSRLEPFKRFAKMIRAHLDGILAWTRLRVSNGALEGMNNKVKAVSHRAFGFRKPESYITAIWHCCGDLPLE